jgi:hypothetical protein
MRERMPGGGLFLLQRATAVAYDQRAVERSEAGPVAAPVMEVRVDRLDCLAGHCGGPAAHKGDQLRAHLGVVRQTCDDPR